MTAPASLYDRAIDSLDVVRGWLSISSGAG
jgi:hypothetical protein